MLAREVQGKAGGSGTVRAPSLCTGPAKASAEQTALSAWPLLRQGMLPSMALALRDEAGRVGISHAGDSHQEKSGFQSIYRIFFLQATMLAGLAMLCIQQLKHQSKAMETDFFCMDTLYCSLFNWEHGRAAN